MPVVDPIVVTFTAEPDSNLDRMMTAAEEATDAHARAYLALTEAEIVHQHALDMAYLDSGEKSNAAREREAEIIARGSWEKMKRAKAVEVEWDKRTRTALALLSALQSQMRYQSGQS